MNDNSCHRADVYGDTGVGLHPEDEVYFARVFESHQDFLYKVARTFCRRLGLGDAHIDVAHDSFANLRRWGKRILGEAARRGTDLHQAERRFLWKCCRHAAISRYRAERRRSRERPIDSGDEIADAGTESPRFSFETLEILGKVRRCVNDILLNSRIRRVRRHADLLGGLLFGDLRYPEAREALHARGDLVSEGALRVSLCRLRKELDQLPEFARLREAFAA